MPVPFKKAAQIVWTFLNICTFPGRDIAYRPPPNAMVMVVSTSTGSPLRIVGL